MIIDLSTLHNAESRTRSLRPPTTLYCLGCLILSAINLAFPRFAVRSSPCVPFAYGCRVRYGSGIGCGLLRLRSLALVLCSVVGRAHRLCLLPARSSVRGRRRSAFPCRWVRAVPLASLVVRSLPARRRAPNSSKPSIPPFLGLTPSKMKFSALRAAHIAYAQTASGKRLRRLGMQF